MHKPLIKICGVKTPEMARQIALAGADYIGLVFDPHSKRHIGINQAKLIAKTAKAFNAIPVGVFVNHSYTEIENIALATNINVIQLHGSNSKQQHHRLSERFQRIYVQAVLPTGEIKPDICEGLSFCNPERDFLLFDSIQAGSGQSYDWDQFKYQGSYRIGIAGGLSPNNVAMAIQKISPYLLDVSSGIENQAGEKDIKLIRQFIAAVNTYITGARHVNQ